MREKSITDWLWELGVTHERDGDSQTDGSHRLFFAGRCIGRYSANDVAQLLKETELSVMTDTRTEAEIKAYNLHCALRSLLLDYQELVKDTNSEPTFESESDADKQAERALYDNMPLADWEPPATPALTSKSD